MNPDWVLGTDRKHTLSAFERLLSDGGCLVLTGHPQAGHHRLVHRLRATAEDHGHTVLAISRAGVPTPAKQVLLGIWERISPAPPKHIVPRWNAPGPNLPLTEIVIATADAIRRHDDDLVLVVEAPDRYDRCLTPEAQAFSDLASESGRPVLVTSLTTSSNQWRSIDGCELIELTDFTGDDILEVMIAQPFVRGMQLDQVVAARDAIMDGRRSIPPEEAYTLLRAWAEH